MVTVTARLADCPAPPVIVNAQAPAAAGVTVKDVPAAGVIAAIPLHEFCWPAAGVAALNVPAKLAWPAVTICALPAPAAVKARLVDDRATAPGAGLGVGDGDGVGDCVGLAIATGTLSTEPAQPASARAMKKLAKAMFLRLTPCLIGR
jgi:hypothetical protein